MSNRFIWVLIILGFLIFWFFYWTFIYLPNKIEEEKLAKIAIEEWKKEVWLVKVKSEKKENIVLTPEEKIEEIKLNQSFYKIIDLWDSKFFFSKNDNSLELKKDEKTIGNFDLVPGNKLFIQKIYSSKNDFYIVIWNKKYIYNQNTDLIFELDLTIDVKYIKRSEDIFIIVTNNGSYVFDKTDKSLEYFTFFDDFVYYKDSYVWIIKENDETRIKNLWLESLTDNSIYFYNPKTKEKKSLYETNLTLEKIYFEDEFIYFIDSNDDIYKLENLE